VGALYNFGADCLNAGRNVAKESCALTARQFAVNRKSILGQVGCAIEIFKRGVAVGGLELHSGCGINAVKTSDITVDTRFKRLSVDD
jgi:hypothetical protein